MKKFNEAYPDDPRVRYYSIAGRTDRHWGGSVCDVSDAPSFITDHSSQLDPVDPLFSLTEGYLDGALGNLNPNDGLVRVKDARWGRFLGCVPADHLDEIGHLFGDDPGNENAWRHKDFYRGLVQFSRDEGL